MKVDKTGLTGDTLKLFDELEKRISETPDLIDKKELEKELETRTKQFKDLELDKEKIDQLKEMLGDTDKGVRNILKKLGTDMTELKLKGTTPTQNLSVRAQVEA